MGDRMKQTQLMTHEEMQLKTKIKVILREYWRLCAVTAVIILIMNYFCRANDSDTLKWILSPTAWWAGVLGGTYFEYLPHQGYVNYFHRFLIAPSCAGSRFMLITFLMLAFSFRLSDVWHGNRQHKMQKEYLWFGFSIVFSYLSTVFVNGIRIVVSIYLPDRIERMHLMGGWLTSDRLHTLIGAVIYFTFLCLIYKIAAFIHERIFVRVKRSPSSRQSGSTFRYVTERKRLIAPLFWYLLIVLALPFVKRAYHNEWEGFGQYAAVIVGVCGGVYVLFMIGLKIKKLKNRNREM